MITDLPREDCLPEIDDNLVRVPSTATVETIGDLLLSLYDTYDEERQRHYSKKCLEFYDYRVMGIRLATAIETMRREYNVRTYLSVKCGVCNGTGLLPGGTGRIFKRATDGVTKEFFPGCNACNGSGYAQGGK